MKMRCLPSRVRVGLGQGCKCAMRQCSAAENTCSPRPRGEVGGQAIHTSYTYRLLASLHPRKKGRSRQTERVVRDAARGTRLLVAC